MIPSIEELRDQFCRLLPPGVLAPKVDEAAGSAPGAAPALPSPVQVTEFALRGVHLDVTVAAEQVVAAAELLDRNGLGLDTITGVDWMAQNQMEVVYDFFHPAAFLRIAVRARIPRGNPEIPTIRKVFPGADWHERETHEFFGIRFLGHPNLSPLLLPEDATYHPLRKDFAA